ncbi:hypothetical protein KCP76_15465 [Salmonella enterica subsp. enterica serovar Weltevreden]|nr:hypothetical protein KCP76_15465 [Salmonella enterica subsp. enterica serovar Weltevreden]
MARILAGFATTAETWVRQEGKSPLYAAIDGQLLAATSPYRDPINPAHPPQLTPLHQLGIAGSLYDHWR